MTRKMIVLIIALAAAVITAAVTIILLLNQPHDEAEQPTEADMEQYPVSIPIGKYYYHGDTASDFYMDVISEQQFQIIHPNLRGYFEEYHKAWNTPETQEQFMQNVENDMELYDGLMYYSAMRFPESDYNVFSGETLIYFGREISKNGFSGFVLETDGERIITFLENDFILVE